MLVQPNSRLFPTGLLRFTTAPAAAKDDPGEPPLAHPRTPWSSDAELVEAILKGSREHFDLLYDAYFPRVYRFALKRLRDSAEAEDVAQEVFMTIYKVLDSYQGTAPLIVWVFGITRNVVNRRFRKKRPVLEVAGCARGARGGGQVGLGRPGRGGAPGAAEL